jgi:hypothetical protein
VTEGRVPILLVEAKWSDVSADRSLRYPSERYPKASARQVSASGTEDYLTPEGIRVAPAIELLRTLT